MTDAGARLGLRGVAVFVTVLAAGLAGGCTVGDGSGTAVGTLQDVGCNADNTLASPEPYSLKPSFFAGNPIEDVCPPPGKCSGPRTNRLDIRLQQTGNRTELTDTLYFDVLNSYEVARCLRGQVLDGVPQWDTRLVTSADGRPVPGLIWCDWNAADTSGATGMADGAVADGTIGDGGAPVVMSAAHARINLSTQDWVTSSLAPLFTCVEARSVGVALPGSWIDFVHFGSAEQGGDPSTRTAVPGDFKVDFGQRLQASFHLILGDETVQHAIMTNAFIPPVRISGTLDGNFDFDLARGRAAQPFP